MSFLFSSFSFHGEDILLVLLFFGCLFSLLIDCLFLDGLVAIDLFHTSSTLSRPERLRVEFDLFFYLFLV